MDKSEENVVDDTIMDVYIAPIPEESSESIDSLLDYIEPGPGVNPKMALFKAGLFNPGSGEICAKYVSMSTSTVLKQVYNDYPSIEDPGIEEALLFPELMKSYGDDGQELYLDLCEEINLIPVRIFYRGLITDEINLRYYGINPRGFRAMCMALERNRTVKRFDLTGNYLNHYDASYHLGQMLGARNAITELVLNKCYIGAKYFQRAVHLLNLATLNELDLSENDIRDECFSYLTEQIARGAVIKKLNLRCNELTSERLSLLADVVVVHDHITHLDLSWNKFYKTRGAIQLIRALRQSKVLEELNFSYTGLCVGVEVGALLRIVINIKSCLI